MTDSLYLQMQDEIKRLSDCVAGLEAELERAADVKPAKKLKKNFDYPDNYSAFWKEFPTHPNMSKLQGFREWEKLSSENQTNAFRAIAPFKAYCSKHLDYQIIHACRFLKYERFEGFLEKLDADEAAAAEFAKLVFVAIDTPEWRAWKVVQPINSTIWSEIHHANGWHFPSAFPPESPIL